MCANLPLTRRVYTGGADTLVRIWDPELGEDQEPPSAAEATDEVTALAAGVRRLSPRHSLRPHLRSPVSFRPIAGCQAAKMAMQEDTKS